MSERDDPVTGEDDDELQRHPKYLALLDVFGDRPYGTLIPYADIEDVSGIMRDSNRWKGMVASWKRRMLHDRMRSLECVPTEGYRILLPEEQTSASAHKMRLGYRRMKSAVDIAVHTDEAALPNDSARARHSDYMTKAGGLLHLMEGGLKQLAPYKPKPPPALPPRGGGEQG